MKSTAAGLFTALAVAGVAALGGALIVYSELDDAPGGVLIGLLLVVGAAALGMRAARWRG
ncbi:MAG TPA: hypothetical protein VF329_10850 [Gammaproteobacteria bacterium]